MYSKRISHILKRYITNRPQFLGKDVSIGKGVSFGKKVIFNCKHVKIGDGVVFQDNIIINSEIFEIGDYGTIYHNCFFPGPGELRIGHNFWLGTGSIIDSFGGTNIGNNVGIGANSQLWTHMVYGDMMLGCRFDSVKPLVIEDDAWLVGHCLVSPVRIGSRSLAMLGSVITKDMLMDHTYAGIPAVDVTEKFGSQFRVTTVSERRDYLKAVLRDFSIQCKIRDIYKFVRIVSEKQDMVVGARDITFFNVSDRSYTKRNTRLERRLMRFLLPKAKFIPMSH